MVELPSWVLVATRCWWEGLLGVGFNRIVLGLHWVQPQVSGPWWSACADALLKGLCPPLTIALLLLSLPHDPSLGQASAQDFCEPQHYGHCCFCIISMPQGPVCRPGFWIVPLPMHSWALLAVTWLFSLFPPLSHLISTLIKHPVQHLKMNFKV